MPSTIPHPILHRAALILALSVSALAPALAQTATLDQANALFRVQDWPAAEAAYTALTRQDATNGLAWFRLGYTHYQQEHFAKAVQAWQQADQAGFAPAVARYNAATAYARLGQTDDAFAWLGKAAEVGFNRLQQLDTDADLDALRTDPRFAALRTAVDTNARPCHYDERFRQFDFWIGSWDVTSPQGAQAGTNRVEQIQNSCVLQENWTGTGGGTGTSFNYYDPHAAQWKQLWVDATGNHATFAGTFTDGAMRFEGVWVNTNSTTSLMTMTFTPLDDGRVRQYIEQSLDEGQTWNVWFDGYYARQQSQDQ